MSIIKISKFIAVVIVTTLLSGCFDEVKSKFLGESELNVNCNVNGFGTGYCSITNTGNGEGTICGKVTIISNKAASEWSFSKPRRSSQVYCSGRVKPSSTVQLQVKVPGVREICKSMSNCSLKWSET